MDNREKIESIKLRDLNIEAGKRLRELGYDVRIGWGVIDLFADKYYLLSTVEAIALINLTEKKGERVNVAPYGEYRGGLTWFDFARDIEQNAMPTDS